MILKEKKTMNVFSKGIDISRYQGNPDFAKVPDVL